jgi:hypothetical protein
MPLAGDTKQVNSFSPRLTPMYIGAEFVVNDFPPDHLIP